MYDFHEDCTTDYLSKIDYLVNNFDRMDFYKHSLDTEHDKNVHKRVFTNFSVSEILKPTFRHHTTKTFDSDSESGTSVESSELYSSSDEEYSCSIEDSCPSQSPEYIHNFDIMDTRGMPNRVTYLRHLIREEDHFSSEGLDCEAALDLRIQRKKTPPKLTETLPAWVFCTRYSDRPSAGPRNRRPRQKSNRPSRRNRTAFSSVQLEQLGLEFDKDPYLSESRRAKLAEDLDLSQSSVKIWFQNQRAKSKKDQLPHPLAVRLAEDGLYNHKTTLKTS